jgi:Excreted virulence factor EspC, type VII ESX diderm
MSDKVTVVTAALRAESKKWTELSSRLQPIAEAAKTLTLGPLAFFAGFSPDFVAHSNAYNSFQNAMVKILGEGVTEFQQLSIVLDRIADNYDESDEKSAQDLDKIYSL